MRRLVDIRIIKRALAVLVKIKITDPLVDVKHLSKGVPDEN